MGTLYDARDTNVAFDIVPLMSDENGSRKKRSSFFGDRPDLFDSDSNHHFITRRSVDQQNLPLFDVNDYVFSPGISFYLLNSVTIRSMHKFVEFF